MCQHNWNSTWSSDLYSHWHDCSICKGKGDIAAHTYDQQVKTKAYEKSSATCLSGTTYYMSCVCGAKGADTFEIGDKDPDNHSGILNNDWKSNDTKHWKEYACCGAHAEEVAHSGGTATCQNKAVCSTCNKPYGDLGSHVPASTWSKDASGHWHACQTPNCNEQLAFAAHTPILRPPRMLRSSVRYAAMSLLRLWNTPMTGVHGSPTVTEHIPAPAQRTAATPKQMPAPAVSLLARTRQYALSVTRLTAPRI